MRYLLIDSVTEIQIGDRIRGVKNISMSEDFLSFHFPGNPVMPGSLLLESLVQLAGWLEAESSECSRWVLLGRVRKCRYYGFARPGDQVNLEVLLLAHQDSNVRLCRGIGRIGGKKLIDAEFEGVLHPLSALYGPAEAENLLKILKKEKKGIFHG